jgi:hypothetical protein
MMAALICVFSVGAFLQFVMAYCRSIVTSASKVTLSADVYAVARVQSVSANDFERFLPFMRLCPGHRDERRGLSAVSAYYNVLNLLSKAVGAMAPGFASWVEREQQNCSHFAAVALDRRISYNRELFLRQATNPF